MIVYFANRAMKVLGLASTELPEGFHITDDSETADVETGLAVLECTVHWTHESRSLAKECTAVGNYILKEYNEFESKQTAYRAEVYTIIEVEEDTKDRTTYVYAESGGMDLINSVVGPYEATTDHAATFYINMFAENSGFKVNSSEISDLSRKLEWTGEASVAERIASVATQFDNAEIEYVVTVLGLQVWEKLINIHKKRGEDNHVILRLNQEVDRIVTTTSIADLATALYVEGGIPEGEEDPVTLEGYTASADGGDIYTDGDGIVKSKSALEKWTRYANAQEPYQSGDGHIVKRWSYDTTSQSELFNRAVTQLQKIYTPAVNYEIDVTTVPDEISIGDYIYIIDEEGELFVQSRVLQIQTCASDNTAKLTLGDYRMVSDGLSTQVDSLSSQLSSVRSQVISTAADVYGLESDVDALSTEIKNVSDDLSNYVKTSGSVSVTLYNSTGTATGTLRFSSGMSLSLAALFSDYATEQWVYALSPQLRIENDTGYAYAPFSLQNGLTLNIQSLFDGYALSSQIPDVSGFITADALNDYVKNDQYATLRLFMNHGSAHGDYPLRFGEVIELNLEDFVSGLSENYLYYDSDKKQTDLAPNNGQSGTNTIQPLVKFENSTHFNPNFNDEPVSFIYANQFYGESVYIDASDMWEKGGMDISLINFDGCVYINDGCIRFNNSYIYMDKDGRITMNGGNITGVGTLSCKELEEGSDARLKTSIQPLETSKLDNLAPVSFKWKDGDDRRHYGYIAQQVQEHIPELVHEGTDGMLGITYNEIIPLLHCKIKEQQAKIESLEERIEKLEALINANT